MKITNLKIVHDSGFTTFSAEVSYRHQFARKLHILSYLFQKIKHQPLSFFNHFSQLFFEKETVWFRVPTQNADLIHWHDAFFIIGLVLSLKIAEPLEFNGSVSTELLNKAKEIEKYYRFEAQPRKITIRGTQSNPTKLLSKNRIAQFFSLGMDSFYSLAQNMRQKDVRPNLLFVDGYDIPLTQKKFLQNIHRRISKVAKETNCDSVFIQTNLRSLSNKIMNWGQFHVAALAAVGYLTTFKTIQISGESFDWPDWGLRFEVDKLFSTSQKTISLIGHHITREKKIAFIKKSQLFSLFIKHLRVCWVNASSPVMQYNCSKCQKCLRTKLLLMSLEVNHTPTLLDVDLKALRQIKIAGHVREEWTSIYNCLRKKNDYDWLLPTLLEVLQKPLLV